MPQKITYFKRLLLLLIFLTFNAEANFDKMVIFGDSLSDTGNFASINPIPIETPFFMDSRASDGPVSVEGLADKLGLSAASSLYLVGGSTGSNFAVSGATAAGSNPIDLTTQVDAFLLKNAGSDLSNSLYIMFIGGNDVRNARDANKSDKKAIIKAATQKIDEQLRRLIAAGAKHIMVINSLNVGDIPETRLQAIASNKPRLIFKTTLLSQIFNRKLKRAVKKIEKDTQLDLVLFNAFKHIKLLRKNANALGYTNLTNACFSTATFLSTGMIVFDPDCNNGQNFDKFFFFDEIHISGRTHERLSRALFAVVPEAPED